MPTFLLVPRAEGRADPDWEASLHDGPCTVSASDERMARRYADSAFCLALIERRPGQLRPPASPWSQSRLVRAEQVARDDDALRPDGVVLIPTGPGDDRFRVAARVR